MGLAQIDKCDCGNDSFKINILRESEGHANGVLYECTKCGYILTEWFYQ